MEKTANISGAVHSHHYSQLVVSTGIASLDDLLGGGLPLGTVALLEEDICGSYAKIVLKYFLAEGVVNKHALFVCSQDVDARKHFLSSLPSLLPSDPEPEVCCRAGVDAMKIAFRYENLPVGEKQAAHQFGHYFDLANVMPPSDLQDLDIECWDGNIGASSSDAFSNPDYHHLLKAVKDKIVKGDFLAKDSKKRNLLRLVLHSLGSPMWLSNGKSDASNKDLIKFLYCLRAVVSSASAIAVVTIPSHLHNETLLLRCIHSCDVAMKLEAFSGTELEKNALLSNYHGFFHLTKLAAVNSLSSKHPGSIEYVFKLKRRKLLIEVFHLPPDIRDESADNMLACGSSGKHSLDF